MSQAHPTRRRWFQFGIGSMFVVVTVFAVCLGWELRVVNQRRAMLKWIHSHGGRTVGFSAGIAEGFTGRAHPAFRVPAWRRWIGDEEIEFIIFEKDAVPSFEELEPIWNLFPEASVNF